MKWTYDKDSQNIRNNRGYLVAKVRHYDSNADANGLLFAAAPELLAALEEILAKYLNDSTSYGIAAMDIAKDAIAKAKGGQKRKR